MNESVTVAAEAPHYDFRAAERDGSAPGRSAAVSGSTMCRRTTSPNITLWRCSLIPAGRSTWDTCATTRSATSWRATSGHAAFRCCTRWAGTHSACPAENAARERNIRRAKWTSENIATMRAELQRMGLSLEWEREFATCDPALLRPSTEAVPRFPARGPRRAQAKLGELGYRRWHGAGQRTGDRRPRLAFWRAGGKGAAEPVVPEDHRLRPGPARRARHAGSLARARSPDAAAAYLAQLVCYQHDRARGHPTHEASALDDADLVFPSMHDVAGLPCGRKGAKSAPFSNRRHFPDRGVVLRRPICG